MSALIIGSLVPDLHYFLPLPIDRDDTHTLEGLFWFSLPFGMVVYLVFHLLIKRPLVWLLPTSIAAKLVPFASGQSLLPRVKWTAVLISLYIGTATHLIWDAFTHGGAAAVQFIPLLQMTVFRVGDYPVRVYQVLQQCSTFGGLALIGLWCLRWLRMAPAYPLELPLLFSVRERNTVLLCSLLLSGVFALVAATTAPIASNGLLLVRNVLKSAVVEGMSVLGIVLLTYSVIWHLRAFRLQRFI